MDRSTDQVQDSNQEQGQQEPHKSERRQAVLDLQRGVVGQERFPDHAEQLHADIVRTAGRGPIRCASALEVRLVDSVT